MKNVLIVFLSLVLAGCGTVRTVTQSNWAIGHDLYQHDTKCESTSRVFSGVAYDFCRLHAEPNRYEADVITELVLMDMMVFSLLGDVIMLPVTVVQQILYGNVEVYQPPGA